MKVIKHTSEMKAERYYLRPTLGNSNYWRVWRVIQSSASIDLVFVCHDYDTRRSKTPHHDLRHWWREASPLDKILFANYFEKLQKHESN